MKSTTTVYNRDSSKPIQLFQMAAIIALAGMLLMSCTTQDFEYAGKSNDVYRVKIENIGNTDITYSPEISLYYIDGKDSLSLSQDVTIAPDDPPQLITESKQGVYGASIDITPKNHESTYRLTLEKGTGTGENFMLDRIVAEKEGKFSKAIRYGQVY